MLDAFQTLFCEESRAAFDRARASATDASPGQPREEAAAAGRKRSAREARAEQSSRSAKLRRQADRIMILLKSREHLQRRGGPWSSFISRREFL